MKTLMLFFICAFIIYCIQAGTLEDGIALNGNLSSGYNKNVRPIKDQSQALVVDVKLFVGALQEFDEVLERISLVTVFHLTWTDENLTWNASDYDGINTTFFGYKEVWVPEIFLTNPSEKIDSFGKEWHSIRYNSDGKAVWEPGTLIEAACSVNAYYFPFDIQECYLELLIWGYYGSEVKFNAKSNNIDLSYMPEHGTWNFIGTRVEFATERKSSIKYYFRLQRNPQYLIINVIMPILFLNLLNALVFVLPTESGERVSYSITVLLSIAVFMTIVSDILPRTSKPMPIISYVLLGSLFISSLITVITVLNLRLFNKKEDEPVPNWLVRMYHSLKRPWCTCRTGKRTVQDTSVKDDRLAIHHTREGNHTDSHISRMSIVELGMHENKKFTFDSIDESVDLHKVTWQDISSLIDFICLWFTAMVIAFGFFLTMVVTNAASN